MNDTMTPIGDVVHDCLRRMLENMKPFLSRKQYLEQRKVIAAHELAYLSTQHSEVLPDEH